MGTSQKIFILVTTLVCFTQTSAGLRILGIFPVNSHSHHAFCEGLMKGLAKKGHQVDVYGHFPLKKPLPNFNDYSLAGSLPDLSNNLTLEGCMKIHHVDIRGIVTEFGTKFCKLMDLPVFQKLLKNPPTDPPYDLVILEGLMAHCFLPWGRYLNVPMIGMMPNQLLDWQHEPLGNPFISAVMPSMGWKILDFKNFWHRLSNTVLNKAMKVGFNYFVTEQEEYVQKFFGSGYPDVVELQKDHDLMFINTHISLHGALPLTPAVVPIAGVHILQDDNSKLPKDVQEWLDDSKEGCIYVSFGSMVRLETFPEKDVKAFYKSFEKIAPVRVLMKIAKPENLLPGLPSNVMTKSWLPQEQILKHKNTKVFVTHGGLMSGQEAIYYGVPMIGIPLFGDQQLNVEANLKRGILVKIDMNEISEQKLTETFKEVLNNAVYKKNIEQLSKRFTDRPMKPLDEAIFWVEYVARHGKKCLRSPLVDMPWWQANLLDVYGFILLVVVIILYLSKKMLKFIFKLCFYKGNLSKNKASKKNN